MPADAIYCGACSWPLPPEIWRQNESVQCPGCLGVLRLAIFPAVARTSRNEAVQSIADAREASCFYHAGSRALTPCDECGRFLCALCELEIDGRRLCPACLEAGVREGKSQNLEAKRTLYDSIALSIAIIPALLVWPALISAPTALYYCIRYWKAPGSLVPRTKIRFYLAGLFSLTTLAAVVFMIAVTIWAVTHSKSSQ
jgi:hypothetical protein